MKKYIFLALAFSGLYANSAFAYDVYYRAGSALYKKNSTDTSQGISIGSANVQSAVAISRNGQFFVYRDGSTTFLYKQNLDGSGSPTSMNSNNSYGAIFSSDGNYIYYINASDSYKIYKKSASDTSNGSAISTDRANPGNIPLAVTPDGNYIFYQAMGAPNNTKLVKKYLGDSSTGVVISTILRAGSVDVSPDGTKLLYTTLDAPYYLYEKSTSDSLDGSVKLAVGVSTASYSASGSDILYTQYSNSYLYKKSASDTSAGTLLYSGTVLGVWALQPFAPSETCTDGIKNQDEQGIDWGGVCGAPAGKTILCQTGALSTSYTYAPITPSYTGGTDDIITTSPYTRYLSGSSFIDRFYDSSRYYTISTSNLTVSSGALSSFMNSGSTLSVTTVWGVPPGPATLDIELFQNTKVNYVKVNAPSTLQFRVKYDTADFGLYLDPITYKGGDYVRFDSTNHFQITFADSTFTLNSLEWGTFTPVYTLGQMCELIETNLVESMSGSTLGFDAVGLSNVISQITASGSTGSGATQSISSTFGFCNGDFTVLGFDLGTKICEVFTKTEGYINDQLNYKQFFSLINPYVPTTPPPLTFQTPIPKWYSDNTWGITYATGSLTDVMALKLPINRLEPTTTTRAVVVAFSLFLYFAFYALTLVVFFWPILYAMKIVQKIMDLATGFIMGKRVTNGNLFSLPVLFWYYTGYASLVLIVIKFSSNFTPVLTSAQGWIFTFISFINQAWGNYPTFMLVTNSIFVAILGLVLGQIILKLSNFSLRLN